MAEPFLGEIRLVSFNYPPKGWALCNGQLLAISQNQALFSLLGTLYGGNGQTTFALPDLRARFPMHRSSNHFQGERAGEETTTLATAAMPAHTHTVGTQVKVGSLQSPAGALFGAHRGGYSDTQGGAMHSGTVALAGGSQPHQNMPPYLTLNFCIALVGIYPSQA